jgi:hypothetical protein
MQLVAEDLYIGKPVARPTCNKHFDRVRCSERCIEIADIHALDNDGVGWTS